MRSWLSGRIRAAFLCLLLPVAPACAQGGVWMFPPPARDGDSLRALFDHPQAWARTRQRIAGLGYADHWLRSQFSAGDRAAWFRQLAAWHLKLGLEVGALKPWGRTGVAAFQHDHFMWNGFQQEGARIDSIAMDEPFAYSRGALDGGMPFAAQQVADFVALVHRNYPQASIGDIEPYPGIPAEALLAFLDRVQADLHAMGQRGLDFVRYDVDWMHFRVHDEKGAEGWPGLARLEAQVHRRGLPFSLIYWAADYPSAARAGEATEGSWREGIDYEGAAYAATGSRPDEFVIESWLDAPAEAIPDSDPDSFTGSVLGFIREFAGGAR